MRILSRPVVIEQSETTEEYRAWLACCSDLGRMADETEFETWLAFRSDAPYPDECPEAPDGDSYEPGEDDLAFLREGGASC